jgi:hypothetical protein
VTGSVGFLAWGREESAPVGAVADGKPPKAFVEQVKALEAEHDRMDGKIAAVEARRRLGQLDVARALRGLEPALAAWREILRGSLVRARQVLRTLIVGPVVMEPMPEAHGYRWKGQLNGGAVLEGTQKYLRPRPPGTIIVETPPTLVAPFRIGWPGPPVMDGKHTSAIFV